MHIQHPRPMAIFIMLGLLAAFYPDFVLAGDGKEIRSCTSEQLADVFEKFDSLEAMKKWCRKYGKIVLDRFDPETGQKLDEHGFTEAGFYYGLWYPHCRGKSHDEFYKIKCEAFDKDWVWHTPSYWSSVFRVCDNREGQDALNCYYAVVREEERKAEIERKEKEAWQKRAKEQKEFEEYMKHSANGKHY